MDFVSNQNPQIEEMLHDLGIDHIDTLFSAIPKEIKHPPPLNNDGLSEAEVFKLMDAISCENRIDRVNYIGAGAYQHYIPAIVSAITSRSEFLTSYTPYQPEISQGILQATFEFQSAIAALTGMQIANAGVYDGASACAEAALMALRIQKGRKRVLLAESLHPSYRKVVELYLKGLNADCLLIPYNNEGFLDEKAYKQLINSDTACVLIQSPNFFGCLEEMPKWSQIAKNDQALFISCGNPLTYALLQTPHEFGADIAVGDCQPFGLPLQFGGPYIGYMTCKEEFVRQLPGRIVGMTQDNKKQRGFVLTLQAREQHIRREKAVSNICTNQALASLASLITMMWYGPHGLKNLAITNYQRTHYLKQNLSQISGFNTWNNHFNEFTLQIPCDEKHFLNHFHLHGIEPGLALSRFYPNLRNHFLVCVTELKSLQELNQYIEVAKTL